MAKELWFKRSDGIEISCVEESATHEQMLKDGAFIEITGPGGTAVKTGEQEPDEFDLTQLTKKQLFEHAALNDVPVTDKMTKAQIIEAIEEKAAEKTEADDQ